MTRREFIKYVCTVAVAAMLTGCVSFGMAIKQGNEAGEDNKLVVRIAEIEVHPEWLEAYLTAGEGFYQEWGKPARRLKKGDTVNIPANVKISHAEVQRG